MRKITGVLRLTAAGISIRDIALRLMAPANPVGSNRSEFRADGLPRAVDCVSSSVSKPLRRNVRTSAVASKRAFHMSPWKVHPPIRSCLLREIVACPVSIRTRRLLSPTATRWWAASCGATRASSELPSMS